MAKKRYTDFDQEPMSEKRVVVKRKGGVLGKAVALLLGFVIGVGSVAGTVAAVGYYAYSRPIKTVVNKVNSTANTKIDINKYLTEEYASKTVGGLLGEITKVSSELSSGNGGFGTLAKISPAVETALEKLAKKFVELGSTAEADKIVNSLLEKSFSELGTYISTDLLNSIELGTMLQNTKAMPFDTLIKDNLMMVLFYGIEGEDYTVDTANKKIVPIEGGRPFLSIGALRNDGVTETFGIIPLDALLRVKEGDGMMASLAYGSASHYDFLPVMQNGQPVLGTDGKPVTEAVMRQRFYALVVDTFYDENGNALACTFTAAKTAGDYILTFGEGENAYTQYATPYNGVYAIYTDSAKTKPVRFAKTTLNDLMKNPQGILDTIELASVLALDTAKDPNPILITLAYGIEGTDYYYDTDGNRKFYPGKSPKTIADLTGDKMNNLITDLPLSSILTVDLDDALIRELAYGSETHFDYVYTNGKKTGVQMKHVRYTKENGKYYDIDGNEVAVENNVVTLKEGTHYITEKTIDNVTAYFAYKTAEYKDGDEIRYKKTTVGDLQDDPTSLLNNIKLCSVMEIRPDSNPVLLALAYGVKDENYTLKDNNGDGKADEIVPLTPPKTIGDLSGEKMDETVNGLPVDAIMAIDLTDSIMTGLAYGQVKKHYVLVDTAQIDPETNLPVQEVKMLQVRYTKADDKYYDVDGNEVTVTDSTVTVDGETHYITEKTVDGVTAYFAYKTAEYKDGDEIHYKKTTVGDLQDDPGSILNGIELGSIFGVSPLDSNPDKLMIALAYGNENEHYTLVDTDSDGIKDDYVFLKDDRGIAYKPRTIQDLKSGSDLFESIYIGDALSIDATSHSVLIALAYGEKDEDYNIVNGEIVSKPGTKRTLAQMQGSGSQALIDGITLESALSIQADSDNIMLALAFGQKGKHYKFVNGTEIDPETNQPVQKVQMLQVRYTFDGDTVYDVTGNTVSCKKDELTGGVYALKLSDTETHYVKNETKDGVTAYFAYKTEACKKGDELLYKKKTIGELSGKNNSIVDSITLADALDVEDSESEDALKRSLAFSKDGHAYTIGELSKDPNSIINNMTLATALSIDHNSDRMMRALAFGQQDQQYKLLKDQAGNATGIEMLQAFYTLETVTPAGGVPHEALVDKNGNEVGELIDNTVSVNGVTQYLTLKDGKYYVYSNEARTEKVLFEHVTIGELSGGSSNVMNNITLADALDVEDNDEADPLKRALAFSKEGHAYTIGELSKDPNSIIYNIHLDSVMHPSSEDKMTLYLLYGKEGMHFEIVETDTTGDLTAIEYVKEDNTTETRYVKMLQKEMAVHHDDMTAGNPLCLHNEYGEGVNEQNLKAVSYNAENVVILDDGKQYVVAYTYEMKQKHEDGSEYTAYYRLLAPDTNADPDKLAEPLEQIRLKDKKTVHDYAPAFYVQEKTDGVWTNVYYEHNTIKELTDSENALLSHLTQRLTLEEILDDSELHSNIFLSALSHTTVDELPQAINQLTITQVFEDKVYEQYKDENNLVYYIDETVDTSVAGANNKLYKDENGVFYRKATIVEGTVQYAEEATDYTRALKGPWRYLLDCNIDDTTDENYVAPEEYTVTQIDLLIPNMTASMQKATLNALHDDGIIELDEDMRQTQISYTMPTYSLTDGIQQQDIVLKLKDPTATSGYKDVKAADLGVTYIGEMTVEELLAYLTAVLNLV
ncbi:MAG: hypothetical protein IJX88_03000 [Clostridia bacterium]|nr:hypothetical protein [Clostridia bacterium]